MITLTTSLVYYSSISGNTRRFIEKTDLPAMALSETMDAKASIPFILAFPSYAGGGVNKDAIPDPVKRFLNDPHNRSLLRGVIAFGNRNFGTAYCLGGRLVAQKCGVPILRSIEITGTSLDVEAIKNGVPDFWKHNT